MHTPREHQPPTPSVMPNFEDCVTNFTMPRSTDYGCGYVMQLTYLSIHDPNPWFHAWIHQKMHPTIHHTPSYLF